MGYTLDEVEADSVECIKKSKEVVKKIFGKDLEAEWTFEVFERIFCYEEAKAQQSSYEQLKECFKVSKEIFGEVEGSEPENVFRLYDAIFGEDGDEEDEE